MTSPTILHEDDDLLALNKPSGLLTEGGDGREDDLEQIASRLCGKDVRCCHRLDRLTSGVVLLRKTARHNAELAALIEQHHVRKLYWALVEGVWPAGLHRIETLIAPVGNGIWANVAADGKPAISTFRVLASDSAQNLSWLSVLLKTGRTHQARLHCAHAGCPIIGDPVYGKGGAELFGLHARELRFRHPSDGRDLKIIAEPPAAWAPVLSRLQSDNTRDD